jgi:hypothetical protein
VLLEMTLSRRERVLFHQILFRSENLFHIVEQSRITRANLMVAAIAQLLSQLTQQLMRIVELSNIQEHDGTMTRWPQEKAGEGQCLESVPFGDQGILSFTLVPPRRVSSRFDQSQTNGE